MRLVDPVREWDAVPDDRPLRVWVPSPRSPHTPPRPRRRLPQDVVLTLTDRTAQDLGPRVPRLMAVHDVGAGDRVTVDLRDASCADLAGLELLLSVLWRRVGTHGRVVLTGGSAGLRAQLGSLGITALTCRAAVYGGGQPPLGAPTPVEAAALPVQRRSVSASSELLAA
jgi:hypothetical protein